MGNRTLKGIARSLDFVGEREAAESILNNRINGNHTTARERWQSLTKSEQQKAWRYLREFASDAELVDAIEVWLDRP